MKREERLAPDEFVTARSKAGLTMKAADTLSNDAEEEERQDTRMEARKALRRLKRERMKGVQNFVNVHLDRETKRRLKMASFTLEISMRTLMEAAIGKFLDENALECRHALDARRSSSLGALGAELAMRLASGTGFDFLGMAWVWAYKSPGGVKKASGRNVRFSSTGSDL